MEDNTAPGGTHAAKRAKANEGGTPDGAAGSGVSLSRDISNTGTASHDQPQVRTTVEELKMEGSNEELAEPPQSPLAEVRKGLHDINALFEEEIQMGAPSQRFQTRPVSSSSRGTSENIPLNDVGRNEEGMNYVIPIAKFASFDESKSVVLESKREKQTVQMSIQGSAFCSADDVHSMYTDGFVSGTTGTHGPPGGSMGTGTETGTGTGFKLGRYGGRDDNYDPTALLDTMIEGTNLEITHFLGIGSYGAIYCARNDRLDLNVAAKSTPMMADITEVKTLMAVQDNPGVIKVHQIVETKDIRWIIMDLADTDLYDVIKDGVDYDSAMDIFKQVVQTVGLLHKQGVAHRDIKPDNVLVIFTADSVTCKIGDFGLATFERRSTKSCGTKNYISPENYRGNYDTFANDVWALGILLVNLVTGRGLPIPKNPESAIEHSTVVEVMEINNKILLILKRIFINEEHRITCDEIMEIIDDYDDESVNQELFDIYTNGGFYLLDENQGTSSATDKENEGDGIVPLGSTTGSESRIGGFTRTMSQIISRKASTTMLRTRTNSVNGSHVGSPRPTEQTNLSGVGGGTTHSSILARNQSEERTQYQQHSKKTSQQPLSDGEASASSKSSSALGSALNQYNMSITGAGNGVDMHLSGSSGRASVDRVRSTSVTTNSPSPLSPKMISKNGNERRGITVEVQEPSGLIKGNDIPQTESPLSSATNQQQQPQGETNVSPESQTKSPKTPRMGYRFFSSSSNSQADSPIPPRKASTTVASPASNSTSVRGPDGTIEEGQASKQLLSPTTNGSSTTNSTSVTSPTSNTTPAKSKVGGLASTLHNFLRGFNSQSKSTQPQQKATSPTVSGQATDGAAPKSEEESTIKKDESESPFVTTETEEEPISPQDSELRAAHNDSKYVHPIPIGNQNSPDEEDDEMYVNRGNESRYNQMNHGGEGNYPPNRNFRSNTNRSYVYHYNKYKYRNYKEFRDDSYSARLESFNVRHGYNYEKYSNWHSNKNRNPGVNDNSRAYENFHRKNYNGHAGYNNNSNINNGNYHNGYGNNNGNYSRNYQHFHMNNNHHPGNNVGGMSTYGNNNNASANNGAYNSMSGRQYVPTVSNRATYSHFNSQISPSAGTHSANANNNVYVNKGGHSQARPIISAGNHNADMNGSPELPRDSTMYSKSPTAQSWRAGTPSDMTLATSSSHNSGTYSISPVKSGGLEEQSLQKPQTGRHRKTKSGGSLQSLLDIPSWRSANGPNSVSPNAEYRPSSQMSIPYMPTNTTAPSSRSTSPVRGGAIRGPRGDSESQLTPGAHSVDMNSELRIPVTASTPNVASSYSGTSSYLTAETHSQSRSTSAGPDRFNLPWRSNNGGSGPQPPQRRLTQIDNNGPNGNSNDASTTGIYNGLENSLKMRLKESGNFSNSAPSSPRTNQQQSDMSKWWRGNNTSIGGTNDPSRPSSLRNAVESAQAVIDTFGQRDRNYDNYNNYDDQQQQQQKSPRRYEARRNSRGSNIAYNGPIETVMSNKTSNLSKSLQPSLAQRAEIDDDRDRNRNDGETDKSSHSSPVEATFQSRTSSRRNSSIQGDSRYSHADYHSSMANEARVYSGAHSYESRRSSFTGNTYSRKDSERYDGYSGNRRDGYDDELRMDHVDYNDGEDEDSRLSTSEGKYIGININNNPRRGDTGSGYNSQHGSYNHSMYHEGGMNNGSVGTNNNNNKKPVYRSSVGSGSSKSLEYQKSSEPQRRYSGDSYSDASDDEQPHHQHHHQHHDQQHYHQNQQSFSSHQQHSNQQSQYRGSNRSSNTHNYQRRKSLDYSDDRRYDNQQQQSQQYHNRNQKSSRGTSRRYSRESRSGASNPISMGNGMHSSHSMNFDSPAYGSGLNSKNDHSYYNHHGSGDNYYNYSPTHSGKSSANDYNNRDGMKSRGNNERSAPVRASNSSHSLGPTSVLGRDRERDRDRDRGLSIPYDQQPYGTHGTSSYYNRSNSSNKKNEIFGSNYKSRGNNNSLSSSFTSGGFHEGSGPNGSTNFSKSYGSTNNYYNDMMTSKLTSNWRNSPSQTPHRPNAQPAADDNEDNVKNANNNNNKPNKSALTSSIKKSQINP